MARFESIWMLLAFSCYHNFTLQQMDVKNAFLNRFIKEEVYVKQRMGFAGPREPNCHCKLNKALYSLKQTPRDWYEILSKFLISQGFVRGKIDTTLFTNQRTSFWWYNSMFMTLFLAPKLLRFVKTLLIL